MITFLIGLIVIISIMYTLYSIGRVTARILYKQPNPDIEEILLSIAILIAAVAITMLCISLIYLVGEVCIRAFA